MSRHRTAGKRRWRLRATIVTLVFLPRVALAQARDVPGRRVAVTVDDVPGTPLSGNCDGDGLEAMNRRLLAAFRRARAPVTGFVTVSRVCEPLRLTALPEILALWLGDGHELGNHTFSHPDLNRTSVREFEADVAAARHVIDPLVTALGGSVRYFRYPQLHTGDDQRVKRDVADYLSGLGYVNAPVTIDSQEWVFAAAYDRALAAGDSAAARCVADAYLPFMERVVAFFEQRAREVVGREPSQVLLIHANLLNAETFDGLAGMFEARGYAFVTLEEALRDPAYGRADTYVGPRGLSWIHRWAADVGLEPREEPREPSWIAELSQAPPGRRWVCPNT